MTTRAALLAPLAAAVLVLSTACGSASPESTGSSTGKPPGASTTTTAQEVTVFAAASLKCAFTEIEKAHPELKITTNYDGSNGLLDQLSGGARADVFASADTTTMDRARAADVVAGEPKTFATNVLVLVVPKGNPAKITGMNDTLTGTKLVICAAKVPCGNATRALADHLGLTLGPVSEETKVTDVRGKVESGEADAGIVYATDAKVSGDKVEVIDVPEAKDIVNEYPIAVVKGAARPDAARAFINAVLSDQGRAVLAEYGFGTP